MKDIKLGKRYKYDVLNEVLGMYQKAYRKLSQNEDRFISVSYKPQLSIINVILFNSTFID